MDDCLLNSEEIDDNLKLAEDLLRSKFATPFSTEQNIKFLGEMRRLK